jgi:hypothetical protein
MVSVEVIEPESQVDDDRVAESDGIVASWHHGIEG